jgi:hypothetical protein
LIELFEFASAVTVVLPGLLAAETFAADIGTKSIAADTITAIAIARAALDLRPALIFPPDLISILFLIQHHLTASP